MESKTEAQFFYKGYPCVILFQPMGFRCGYVGVPKDSIFANKTSYALNSVFDVHGGITYSSAYLYDQVDTSVWWIGFDCGHAFDGYDVQAAKKYFGKDISDIAELYKDNKVRTREYVETECRDLVNQIENLEYSGYTELDMCIAYMKYGSDDMRDPITKYLEEYKALLERPLNRRLIDVLREVRGEK